MTKVPIKIPCAACKGSGRNNKGQACAKCGGTGERQESLSIQELAERVAKLLRDESR